MAGGNFDQGLARVKAKEVNIYRQGKSGAETVKLGGPVRSVKKNPHNGGINRSTKGTGAGKAEY